MSTPTPTAVHGGLLLAMLLAGEQQPQMADSSDPVPWWTPHAEIEGYDLQTWYVLFASILVV